MSKLATLAYCARCWCRIPPDAPRVTLSGSWLCCVCAYDLELEERNRGK
jgi:hypothetical protein